MAMVLSWMSLSTWGASSDRLWLMTVIPSAFQATVLPDTVAWSELDRVMAPPQYQPEHPQLLFHRALPVTVRSWLDSRNRPLHVLSWTRLPVMVAWVTPVSVHRPRVL